MFQAIIFLVSEFIKWLDKKTLVYEPYKPRMYGDKGNDSEEW